MTENPQITNKRNLWLRGFYMLLMIFAFHVSITLMYVITVIQFLLALLNDSPNERLLALGGNLARYLRQIANFLTFSSEEIPFPFSEWPEDS